MKDDKSPYVYIAELEAEVRELQALLAPKLRRPGKWRLCDKEYAVLRAISAGNGAAVSPLRIHRAIYGRCARSPEALRQHVYHLRRKMAPYGVIIGFERPNGYWIDAAGLKIVRGES